MQKIRSVTAMLPVLMGLSVLSVAEARVVNLGEINDYSAYPSYDVTGKQPFADRTTFRVNAMFETRASNPILHPTHAAMVTDVEPALYRKVLSVAAVPQAETGLMVLSGLGLVVFQLRRTQRSLRHRPLAE